MCSQQTIKISLTKFLYDLIRNHKRDFKTFEWYDLTINHFLKRIQKVSNSITSQIIISINALYKNHISINISYKLLTIFINSLKNIT